MVSEPDRCAPSGCAAVVSSPLTQHNNNNNKNNNNNNNKTFLAFHTRIVSSTPRHRVAVHVGARSASRLLRTCMECSHHSSGGSQGMVGGLEGFDAGTRAGLHRDVEDARVEKGSNPFLCPLSAAFCAPMTALRA